ncbi:penicillin-binding protein 1C [bacterium]|nr:penicillin-binding protein 1C [bacterium]
MNPIQKHCFLSSLNNIKYPLKRWLSVFAGMFVFSVAFYLSLPSPLFKDPYSVILLDRDNHLLGATISQDEQWRFPAMDSVPESFIQAITQYEDKRFFRHPGVDLKAIMRAAWQNIRAGKIISGGSTLTMQVIRLARKEKSRTVWEKCIEIILSIRLELTLNKEEILILYAAHAPFGGNVVGLEAASWRYFGCGPEQLSWAETAMLAVLPNSPALIHPGKNRMILKRKRNDLLSKLCANHVIDSLTCRLAQHEPLPPEPLPLPRLAPHLLQREKQVVQHISQKKTASGSRIKTTLQKQLQMRSARIVRSHCHRLAANEIHNACALILDVQSGHVLAYIGNISDSTGIHGNWVDIIMAPRSTGSILKPLLYAAMMQSGDLLPHTLIPDIPTRLGGFAPQNFDHSYQGAVPASMALARSLNVPAVRMLQDYGVDRFYHFLKQCGFTTLSRPARSYGLSLILGGAEGTLWEITGIYACLARTLQYDFNQSIPHQSSFFMPTCQNIHERAYAGDPPLSAGACWLTLKAMLEVIRPGNEAVWKEFVSSRRVAWKTGTSYGFRDAWAVGVTPEYAVGVWVGNADGQGRPELTGLHAAAPILFDLFNILPATSWFQCPESDLVEIEICGKSGHRKGPQCIYTTSVFAMPAGMHTAPCPYCQWIHYDPTESWQVDTRTEKITNIKSKKQFVLPPVMEWYYKRHHSDYSSLPPYKQLEASALKRLAYHSLSLIYPDNRGVIYVPVELSGQRGRTVFEAAHRHPQMKIFWHIDGHYLGETREIHQMELAPKPGDHILTLIDEQGQLIQQKFTVIQK